MLVERSGVEKFPADPSLEAGDPARTSSQFENVVFDTFPAKVMVEPDEARSIILEARAFCRYLLREYELENAEECLAIVDGDDAIEALHAALANPGNWGMAKSMMMEGKARGAAGARMVSTSRSDSSRGGRSFTSTSGASSAWMTFASSMKAHFPIA